MNFDTVDQAAMTPVYRLVTFDRFRLRWFEIGYIGWNKNIMLCDVGKMIEPVRLFVSQISSNVS